MAFRYIRGTLSICSLRRALTNAEKRQAGWEWTNERTNSRKSKIKLKQCRNQSNHLMKPKSQTKTRHDKGLKKKKAKMWLPVTQMWKCDADLKTDGLEPGLFSSIYLLLDSYRPAVQAPLTPWQNSFTANTPTVWVLFWFGWLFAETNYYYFLSCQRLKVRINAQKLMKFSSKTATTTELGEQLSNQCRNCWGTQQPAPYFSPHPKTYVSCLNKHKE